MIVEVALIDDWLGVAFRNTLAFHDLHPSVTPFHDCTLKGNTSFKAYVLCPGKNIL
jgi:hypothetical protein